MQHDNGVTYRRAEKIIKPNHVKQKNNFKKDYTDILFNRVTLNNAIHTFTLTRLVYNCFIATFDLNNRETLILCKDGNGLNITPKNLILVTPSYRSQRIYKRGRGESLFKNALPEIKEKWRKASAKARRKQVSQYSLTGKRIKIYLSITEAESATGILGSNIGSVASGRGIAAGGYVWRWGKEKTVDVKTFKTEKLTQRRIKYGRKVTQYDFTGNKIAQFPSIRDAEVATGADYSAIRRVLTGEFKSAKGSFWKKGYGMDKIDLSNYKRGKESMAASVSRKVNKLSLTGKIIKTYPSIKEAALTVKISSPNIILACKEKQRTAEGYKWEYV